MQLASIRRGSACVAKSEQQSCTASLHLQYSNSSSKCAAGCVIGTAEHCAN
jgi:hypothetical protein